MSEAQSDETDGQGPWDALDPSARLDPPGHDGPRHHPPLRLGTRRASAALLVAAAAIAALLAFLLVPRPVEMTVETSAATTVAATPRASEPSAPEGFLVHVGGAVREPGIYRLAAGARVIDAVGAAGGFTSAAERAGVNLARPLSDGEQILIPKEGEVLPAAGAGPSGAGPSAGAKVNLNTAQSEELQTLPRVGPALAQRILDWRAEHGRFARREDLMSVSGIGEKTFAGLRDLVTV